MDQKTPKKYSAGVTLRAIILGLVLIPVNGYWIFMSEIIRYQGHPTTISLFYSSIFTLVVLILLNGITRRVRPSWTFSQGELLTVYVMVNIGAALIGHDSMQILVSMMPYASNFATPQNEWKTLFLENIPDWLIVKDAVAVKAFYSGGEFLNPSNFIPWVKPVLAWSSFIIVLLGMFLCINVLLRKQWTEREKLSYPLVQLPFDMTMEGAPLFRNKLMWYGFLIVAAIDIINGLATLYPSIPMIPIKLGDQSMNFTARPWNFIGWLPTQLYPFGIGLGMLLPVDLLFSCWFFFWVWKAERILMAVFGLETIRGMPFTGEQSFGAYMGIAVFAIWMARKHFANLFRHFVGLPSDVNDEGEPISYNAAIWFLIFGAIYLTVFSLKAGMSMVYIVPFFLMFFAMSIAITRMRAELGPPAHDLHAAGPDALITGIVGPNRIDTQSLGVFSLFFWFNRAYRSHVMPFQLEGFKMAERAKMSYRGLFMAMAVASVFGTFAAFYIILHLLYQNGAGVLAAPNVPMIFGGETWGRMDSWVKGSIEGDMNRAAAIGVGFGLTLLLNFLRMHLTYFPFHPVGYAVSSSWSMHLLWLPLFIAWVIKLVILRYGGLKLYTRALPFFLGLILGECVVGSFWTIYGIIFRVPSYAFWP